MFLNWTSPFETIERDRYTVIFRLEFAFNVFSSFRMLKFPISHDARVFLSMRLNLDVLIPVIKYSNFIVSINFFLKSLFKWFHVNTVINLSSPFCIEETYIPINCLIDLPNTKWAVYRSLRNLLRHYRRHLHQGTPLKFRLHHRNFFHELFIVLVPVYHLFGVVFGQIFHNDFLVSFSLIFMNFLWFIWNFFIIYFIDFRLINLRIGIFIVRIRRTKIFRIKLRTHFIIFYINCSKFIFFAQAMPSLLPFFIPMRLFEINGHCFLNLLNLAIFTSTLNLHLIF